MQKHNSMNPVLRRRGKSFFLNISNSKSQCLSLMSNKVTEPVQFAQKQFAAKY